MIYCLDEEGGKWRWALLKLRLIFIYYLALSCLLACLHLNWGRVYSSAGTRTGRCLVTVLCSSSELAENRQTEPVQEKNTPIYIASAENKVKSHTRQREREKERKKERKKKTKEEEAETSRALRTNKFPALRIDHDNCAI